MTVTALVERTVAPLDQARRAWFALALRSELLARLLTRRDLRTITFALLHAVLAFGLALFFPMILFVLGPVLLGVVHVAADVRYLVLRQELASFWRKAVWAFCGALILLRVLWEAKVPGDFARAETTLVLIWIALAILSALHATRAVRRALIAGVALSVIGVLSLLYPLQARLVFAHVHNFVALALWGFLLRDRVRTLIIPCLFVFAASALFLSGTLYSLSLHFGAKAFDLHLLEAADWLAPGLRADYAVGLVCAYVFLQSIHYAVWLFLIPQQQTQGQGTLTFRMSARSLVHDFGALGLGAIVLTTLFVLCSTFFEVLRTRSLYLSIAMFHGYLELAFLAYFWVKAGKPSAQLVGA